MVSDPTIAKQIILRSRQHLWNDKIVALYICQPALNFPYNFVEVLDELGIFKGTWIHDSYLHNRYGNSVVDRYR